MTAKFTKGVWQNQQRVIFQMLQSWLITLRLKDFHSVKHDNIVGKSSLRTKVGYYLQVMSSSNVIK